ncbi:hypothetical protein SLEP1_g52089 [Rubroshorea leprosula]|uniref:Uncharacterized protein n=1 Tax=Rubroshorea leprosula TaxID=152421 RepID=A0AAV5M631_9ROSI|nr:hypothetical protein SLEP1_g52089 [Rubroshorea leprosula]
MLPKSRQINAAMPYVPCRSLLHPVLMLQSKLPLQCTLKREANVDTSISYNVSLSSNPVVSFHFFFMVRNYIAIRKAILFSLLKCILSIVLLPYLKSIYLMPSHLDDWIHLHRAYHHHHHLDYPF